MSIIMAVSSGRDSTGAALPQHTAVSLWLTATCVFLICGSAAVARRSRIINHSSERQSRCDRDSALRGGRAARRMVYDLLMRGESPTCRRESS